MDDYCMTREQAEEEMQQFQKIFSVVRIIGLEQLQLLAEGKAERHAAIVYPFGHFKRRLSAPSWNFWIRKFIR